MQLQHFALELQGFIKLREPIANRRLIETSLAYVVDQLFKVVFQAHPAKVNESAFGKAITESSLLSSAADQEPPQTATNRIVLPSFFGGLIFQNSAACLCVTAL
jgi:hypothetical protein